MLVSGKFPCWLLVFSVLARTATLTAPVSVLYPCSLGNHKGRLPCPPGTSWCRAPRAFPVARLLVTAGHSTGPTREPKGTHQPGTGCTKAALPQPILTLF